MKWNPFSKPDQRAALQNDLTTENKKIEMLTNAISTGTAFRARMAAAISGGYDFADTLHNVYLDYGYPAALSFTQFWNMYRRFGIAKNVIELPVDFSWLTPPTIESKDPGFTKGIETLVNDVKMFQRLKALDNRRRVGRYAGMFMRVKDSKNPDQPLESVSGVGALMQMVPLYEGQLEVLTTNDEPKSERFSLPETYQFNSGGTGSKNEKAKSSFTIHWSRIVPAAEDADNGGIYGVPVIEACYNSLMDLRKIIGAGGEGFYKNASQNLIHSLKDASSAKVNKELLDKFDEHTDDFLMNRMRRSMWTPGMDTKVLESSLANPKEVFNNAINDVAASSKIPATILIGQQTGRLASQEDSKGFLSGVNSRRENSVSEMIDDVVEWCMKYKVLPSAEYEIVWDDLLSPSNTEKIENAFKLADTNSKQFTSGGDIPFSGAEIREAAGYDPEVEIEPGGETDDDIDDGLEE